MLKSFEVSNFKSFKNKTVFDLEKTNYQVLANTNVNENILKGLMFVGANASGKSNAILAIKFLLDSLFGKNNVYMDNDICMFSKNPIMSFNYAFDINGTEIIYDIQYQRIDKKIKEDLLVAGKNVFTRDGSVATVNITEEVIHTDVPKNTLFLRDIYFNTKFRGQEVLQKWFEFLSNSVYLDLYSKNAIQYKSMDLSLKSYLEEKGADEINTFFKEYNFEQIVEYDNHSEGNMIAMESVKKMIFFR